MVAYFISIYAVQLNAWRSFFFFFCAGAHQAAEKRKSEAANVNNHKIGGNANNGKSNYLAHLLQ